MNTRRFPRTMNEAFPRTAAYANAFERHDDHSDLIVLIACAACGIALVCFAVIGWLA